MNTVEDFLKERQQIMVKAVIAGGRNSRRVYLLLGMTSMVISSPLHTT